jgi:hypothetical protein
MYAGAEKIDRSEVTQPFNFDGKVRMTRIIVESDRLVNMTFEDPRLTELLRAVFRRPGPTRPPRDPTG